MLADIEGNVLQALVLVEYIYGAKPIIPFPINLLGDFPGSMLDSVSLPTS